MYTCAKNNSIFDHFLIILVYGALLGRQKGRFIELCTSFEIKMNPIPNNETIEDIDLEFLNTNISQCNALKFNKIF